MKCTKLIASALLVYSSLLTTDAALAVDSPPGGFDLEHCALSGDPVDQPSDNKVINFCCYDDGCWQCDGNWQNCIWEPAMYREPGTLSDPFRRKLPGTNIDPAQPQEIAQ